MEHDMYMDNIYVQIPMYISYTVFVCGYILNIYKSFKASGTRNSQVIRIIGVFIPVL